MNIETKTVIGETIDFSYFGWQHTEDTTVKVGKHRSQAHVLARDKDMPNYRLISTYEKKYFELKNKKEKYEPIDGLFGFILFILGVVPFVIYALFKSSQKKRIKNKNDRLQQQMDYFAREASKLL